MAYTKKTLERKNTPVATVKKTEDVKNENKEEVISEEIKRQVKEVIKDEIKAEISEEPKQEKAEYDATDGVPCRSVTAGQLIMIGKKTGNLYNWSNFGDTTEVEYQDLKAAKLTKSQYIYLPYFIIDDAKLLATNEWKHVDEMYANMYTPDDMDELFNLPNAQFKKVISEMPTGLQNTVRTMSSTRINDCRLDSIAKIKIIDDVLGTDLLSDLVTE